MKKIGFLFPGQGAQYVGMGKDFFETNSEAKEIFLRANELLGFNLTKLCFEGPDEELTRTVNAQTAIFVTSLAILAVLKANFQQVTPSLACGLSLGEFTALVALGSISFEDGLRLVRRRGELMEEACQKKPGTMASIMGLPLDKCVDVCKVTGAELANLNSPEQYVISGSLDAIEFACSFAKTKGAKRAIQLKVGGAFHSSLMKHAESGLEEALRHIEIKAPTGTFIPNVKGEVVAEPETIRMLLARQLTSPVQWIKTMESILGMEPFRLIELGPGKVLKGLARKINTELNVISIEKKEDLESLKTLSTVRNAS